MMTTSFWRRLGGAIVAAGTLAHAPGCGSGDNVVPACDNNQLKFGCVVGRCTVRSDSSPLPDKISLVINEIPVTDDLAGDAIGPSLCSLTLPNGTAPITGLTLSIKVDHPPDPNAILFQHRASNDSSEVPTSEPGNNAIVGVVGGPGDYGVTERPGNWSIEGYAGQDVLSSGDEASLIRNISSQRITSAFYDGTRLYVGDGPRVLIYKGIPKDPSIKPDVVLGQPDLDTVETGTSSSLMGSYPAMGIWSDGTRLVVNNEYRVLIWTQVPTFDFTPADIVLGQPDFSTNKANNGGVSAQSLAYATAVSSDGANLLVADTFNNRVLQWSAFPTLVDQPADLVIGQPDFASSGVAGGAIPLYQPWGVAASASGNFIAGQFGPGVVHTPVVSSMNPINDFVALPIGSGLNPPDSTYSPASTVLTASGGLAIRSAYLYRIAMVRSLPAAATTIDFALGQPDAIHVVKSEVCASVVQTATDQDGLSFHSTYSEEGLGGGKMLLVTDNARLLLYEQPPTYSFEPASRVLGQAGFTTNGRVDYRAISAATLAGPADISAAGGVVAVADRGNNRVLLFKQVDLQSSDSSAYVVLGQPNVTSYVPNVNQVTPSATTLSGPAGVALDGVHLIVADSENHRVLIWNTVPKTNGAAPDVVLGQSDFSGRRPNKGRGDANNDGSCDTGADGMFYPTGVASDGAHLFVADRLNNRVLVWSTFPTTNGKPATAVLGQPDFTTSNANRGAGPFSVAADGFNLPTGVTLSGTTLWVADSENNRVVRWDNVTTSGLPGAYIGQAYGTVVANPNYRQPTDGDVGFPQTQSTSAGSVLRPRAVAVVGGDLVVTETDSSRAHVFDATTLSPLGELGQADDNSGTADTNGVSAATLSVPLGVASDGTNVWIADSGNHRVLGYPTGNLQTGTPATTVLGQASMLTSGFNQSSTAAGSVTSQPRGLALSGGMLYVADTNNNRVLVMQTPVASGDIPVRVLGQPDDSLALANSGGVPSARTLNRPRGVFAHATHVIVSDTGNNRVLVFDVTSPSMDATIVLGQPDFASAKANGGGGPSASTMQAPTAAFTDGTSFYVADSGNHRVLVWNKFPTANGQPADLVLGQPDASSIFSNRGVPAAAPDSMSFPSAIEKVQGVLLIADSGNNRVLMFATAPASSGAAADGVIGQPDLVSRTAAAMPNDLTRLAGPVAMSSDGTSLYVIDRDLARVVAYRIPGLHSAASASLSVGISGGISLKGPGGIAVERTPFFTSRVYVADTGDDQLTLLTSVSRLAAAP